MKIERNEKNNNFKLFYTELECLKINEEFIPLKDFKIVKNISEYDDTYEFYYEYENKQYSIYSTNPVKILWDINENKPYFPEVLECIEDDNKFILGNEYYIRIKYSERSIKKSQLTKISRKYRYSSIITYEEAIRRGINPVLIVPEYKLDIYSLEYYFDNSNEPISEHGIYEECN